MEVRDARLFARPLGLALLQAANLSLPRSGSFDRVSARYLVIDNTVLFDSLSFEAPTVAMTGSGRIWLPTQELDLIMFNRNPRALTLGPLTDLYNTLKDELIAIRVRGTLNEPDAKMRTFTNFRSTWDDLFATRRAKAQRAGQTVERNAPQ